MKVDGRLKCKHFKSPQAKSRIANPPQSSHLRRTLKPLKSQGVNQILARGMMPQETLPRWCVRKEPSCYPAGPHFPTSSSMVLLAPRGDFYPERAGVIAPLQVALRPPKWSGVKVTFFCYLLQLQLIHLFFSKVFIKCLLCIGTVLGLIISLFLLGTGPNSDTVLRRQGNMLCAQ